MAEWAGTYGKYSVSAQRHIDAALKHVVNRRVAIQAGGHVGQFPVYLAQHFEAVYTWEPMAADFRDLIANIELAGVSEKVFACRGMLGSDKFMGKTKFAGSGSCTRDKGYAGTCPIYRLDDIALPNCDLIYLDVEGDERDILIGASNIITRCLPVIVTEERAKSTRGTTEEFLRKFGYRQVGSWMADVIWAAEKNN